MKSFFSPSQKLSSPSPPSFFILHSAAFVILNSAAFTCSSKSDVSLSRPSDPFEQLDVARKITSIALSARLSILEDESDALRAKLADQDALVSHLQSQTDSLDSSLSDKLAQAQLKKESLVKENASLSNTEEAESRCGQVGGVPEDTDAFHTRR